MKLIHPFKDIWEQDADNRKRNALKELAYVWFMADVKSPFFVFPVEERKEKVKVQVGLPEGWKHTKLISKAIDKYIELSDSPSKRALRSVKEALTSTTEVVDIMNSSIMDKLESIKRIKESTSPDDVTALEGITALITAVNSLLTLAKKLPEAIAVVSTLEEKVTKDEMGESKIRGGGDVGEFEQ